MNLPKTFKNKVSRRVDLSRHTSLRIGGRALYWFEPRDENELSSFLKEADPCLPLFVIGRGSNLLVKDGLIKKVFIHLNAAAFTGIEVRGTKVSVGAGVTTAQLTKALRSRDLAGYEFLAGIPGTIGGALVMNAGARSEPKDPESYREMKDIVAFVDVLDRKGRFLRLTREQAGFSYRTSGLKPFYILGAQLILRRQDKDRAMRRIKDILAWRRGHQDLRSFSAGSFFKNPPKGKSAGQLIDLCGLRGFSVGGAKVSDVHANFIVNTGNARARDVIKLMEIIRKNVYNRFHIDLQSEVEVVS